MMLTIQGQRLQQQLETLAELARGPEGICRLAYSESFWRSNEYVAGLMRQVVMETDPDMVGTVGKLDVTPNAMNTIPGKVVLTLELRALNAASIDIAYQRLMDEFRDDISACQLTMQQPSYHMDDTVRQAIREAAADLGFTWMDMGSGAGHDSMSLAQVTRAGMIFVPSIGGISHSPLEKTSWEDVANGANVLLRAAEKLDRL